MKTTSVASNLHNIRYYDLCNAWNVTARVAEDLGVDPGRLSMQGKVVVMDMGTAKAAQAWLNRFAAVGGCGYSAWRSCTLLQQMRGKKALCNDSYRKTIPNLTSRVCLLQRAATLVSKLRSGFSSTLRSPVRIRAHAVFGS